MCEFTVISTAFIPTQQGNACDVITKLQKNRILSKKKFLMRSMGQRLGLMQNRPICHPM